MCTCTFESAVISARPSWRFTAVGLHGAVLKTYTICALIFCVAPMGQACVTCGATQGLPALVYSKADFRLYTRIVLFAAGHDGLVSVTSNIVRKIDIFGVLSLTSYPMHLHCHLRHTHLIFLQRFLESSTTLRHSSQRNILVRRIICYVIVKLLYGGLSRNEQIYTV